jgi:hypothetical protein
MDRNRYILLGAVLVVAGASILATSLVVLRSYPGVSTGMALLVLGFVILLLGKTAPGVSPELADLLVRVGYENLGRLLEELGAQTRAVYLPSHLVSGGPRAFIPLTGGSCAMQPGQLLEDRLVVSCGGASDEVGLVVSSPGTAALTLLEYPPGASMDEIAVALTQVAVASLRIARGIDVYDRGDRIEVRFHGEPPFQSLSSVVEWCLGSLGGSVAAAVVSEAKGRKVTIESETVEGASRNVVLLLHDG